MLHFFTTNTYLTGAMLYGIFWLFVLVKTKRYRETFVMGAFFGAAAVIIGQFYALDDYWHPAYVFGRALPIEDFLYGFFYGGALASLPEVFEKRITYTRQKTNTLFGFFGLSIMVASFVFFVDVLGLNSIIAHIIPLAVIGFIIAFRYPYLVSRMVLTSFGSVLITVCVFKVLLYLEPAFIETTWMLKNLSGLFFLEIPIEEYLFAIALGFGTPYFYEVVKGTLPKYQS